MPHTLTPAAYSGGMLLALDGELPDPDFILHLRPLHSLLIAADGAALKLRDHGLVPNVVVGDLDTVGAMRDVLIDEGIMVIEEATQEMNDFEKALRWIIGRGAPAATVIGIGGGMTDHALNNFSVLARYARHLRLVCRDERSVAYAVCDSITLGTTVGDRISLIPLPTVRLSTTGLAWELADDTLRFGDREGASNHAVLPEVSVHVEEGTVMVFHYPSPE